MLQRWLKIDASINQLGSFDESPAEDYASLQRGPRSDSFVEQPNRTLKAREEVSAPSRLGSTLWLRFR